MMALGKRVYSQNCVACHQATGLGTPGVYPPLVSSDWVQDKPERIIKVLLSGLSGKVVVNGQQFENAMTPFKKLKDQQIAAVLTFIRTNPDYQNDSYEVSEELVKEVRAAYGERQDTWSQAELEAIHGPVTGDWKPTAVPVVEEPAAEATEAEGTEVEVGTEEPVPAEA